MLRITLKFVMQNDWDFVGVILLYYKKVSGDFGVIDFCGKPVLIG